MMEKYLIILLVMQTIVAESKELQAINLNQNDYHMIIERVEVAQFDKNFIYHDIKTFKYNRTCTALNNWTIMITADIQEDEMVSMVQIYKFMSNEYRLFPLRAQASFCRIFKENIGDLREGSCGNFTGCPFAKGQTYQRCNWVLNDSKLPPYLPSGKCKGEMKYLYNTVQIVHVNYYYMIIRPEV